MRVDDTLVPLADEQKRIITGLQDIESLSVLRQLGGGAPETKVYLVDIQGTGKAGTEGTWVLKLDATWRARQEIENQRLLSDTPLKPYLPVLRQSIIGKGDNDLSIQLSSIATGTLLNSRTLEQILQHSTFLSAKVFKRLVTILLEEWNRRCDYSKIRVGDYLKDVVRNVSSRRAGFDGLGKIIDLSKLRFDGHPLRDRWLANPFTLVNRLPEKVERYVTAVPWGHVHGDLHPGNVLHAAGGLESDQKATGSVSVIDVATYRTGNVCFDLAYLELSTMWHLFERFETPVARSSWWKIQERLCSQILVPVSLDGIARTTDILTIFEPARKKLQQHAESLFRRDEYWLAFLLAYFEASLTFAVGPERIAKDSVNHRSLQLAGLLSASIALKSILELKTLSAWSTVEEQVSRSPAETVRWEPVPTAAEPLEISLVDRFDALARQILGPVRSGHCVLVLGDRFASDVLNVPQDGALVKQVGASLGPVVLAGGDTNIGAFDRVTAEESAKQQVIAKLLDTVPEPKPDLAAVTSVTWAAVLDWSFSPAVYRRSNASTSSAFIRVFCDGSSDPDFAAVVGTPYIPLRGSIDEFARLAVGVRGWTRQNTSRRRVLASFFNALRFKPTILFVGFEKSTFDYARTEICDVLGISDSIYVVRHKFSAEDRLFLESSRGFSTAELSPIEFLAFCRYLSHERGAKVAAPKERVLEITGIRRVIDDTGATVFSRGDTSGISEKITLKAEDFTKLDKHLEILHRDILLAPEGPMAEHVPGDFYLGHIIQWQELAEKLAFWRPNPGDALLEALKSDLEVHGPRRLSLWYEAGAGATTLLRQLAFKIYFDSHIPVAFLRNQSRDTYGEVVRYYNSFRRSFVLFADEQDVSRGDADTLFMKLQDRQVPVVLVYASRSGKSRQSLKKAAERQDVTQQRRFYLVDEIAPEQKVELGNKLEAHFGPKYATRCRNSRHTSLFLVLLETFESDFVMVEEVVQGMLGEIGELGRKILMDISFVWYYGHKWLYESVIAALSDASAQAISAELEPLEDRLLWRERRVGETVWLPRHDLLAQSVIAIHLRDQHPVGTPLKEFTIEFIKRLAKHPESTDICRDIVWSLVGTDREQSLVDEMEIGEAGVRTLPSRLMRDIQNIESQKEVWRTVNESFENVPLFLAHYGRFLYGHTVKKYEDSEVHLQRANQLSGQKDHTILHMLGMRFRSELQELLRKRGQERNAGERKALTDRIQFLAAEAGSYFEQSIDVAREQEHGYVSYIQLLSSLINERKAQTVKTGAHASEFLLDPEVQGWLRKAHELVRQAQMNVTGAAHSEYLMKAKGILEGAEGTLDDVIRFYQTAIRRPAFAQSITMKESLSYALLRRGVEKFAKESADTRWREDFSKAADLASQALSDAPYDSERIDLWFQCARFADNTDRAELIQRLEDLWRESQTLEAAFHLCCLYFTDGLEHASSASFEHAERYRVQAEKLSPGGLVARITREWVGQNYLLVPKHMLPPPESDRRQRLQFDGRIRRVLTENDGRIVIDKTGGSEIWFSPHRSGRYLLTQSDLDRPVRFYIGFSFDRPRAWLISW